MRETNEKYGSRTVLYNSEDGHKYVKRSCDVCGSEYCARLSKIKKEGGSGTTCGRSCGAKKANKKSGYGDFFQGKKIKRLEDKKARIDRDCDVCGSSYLARVDKLKQGKGLTCSVYCSGVFSASKRDEEQRKSNFPTGSDHGLWQGGYSLYNSSWRKKRDKVLEKYDYKCFVCGKTKEDIGREPDIHHVKPLLSFKNTDKANELDNLVCLCPEHHRKVEGWGLKPDVR